MNEKVIFISHSSKDAEFAQKVCSVMENNNLPCWIAPRDIPYGNYWCEEITAAISKSKVMLFIFSENSNSKSEQVLREIHQAVKNGVTIITIRLTTYNYNVSPAYWIASPYSTNTQRVYYMVAGGVSSSTGDPAGLRPMVSIEGVSIDVVDDITQIN